MSETLKDLVFRIAEQAVKDYCEGEEPDARLVVEKDAEVVQGCMLWSDEDNTEAGWYPLGFRQQVDVCVGLRVRMHPKVYLDETEEMEESSAEAAEEGKDASNDEQEVLVPIVLIAVEEDSGRPTLETKGYGYRRVMDFVPWADAVLIVDRKKSYEKLMQRARDFRTVLADFAEDEEVQEALAEIIQQRLWYALEHWGC